VRCLALYEASIPYRDDGALAVYVYSLLGARKFAAAEPVARECLRLREKLTPDDWYTFNARSMLGGRLLGQKKYAEAESHLLAGYEGMKQRENEMSELANIRLTEAIDRLIELYTATNKPDEVKKWQAALFKPARDGQVKKLETDHPKTLTTQNAGAGSPARAGELAVLGSKLLKQKKWADAEPKLRESLTIQEENLLDDWTTFNTRSMLGEALLGQKKYADAEPLLLKGYEGMKQQENKIPKESKDRLTQAIDRLIELYTATNKPDEAKRWQAERANYPDMLENKK
jgi:hypothetical protein